MVIYDDIFMLCRDAVFAERAEECEISPLLTQYISEAHRIIKSVLNDNNLKYAVPYNGHRCSFYVIGEKKYVMSLPDKKIESELSEIVRVKNVLGLNNQLVLYENNGYCLMHYAVDKFDWNMDYVKECIHSLKRIHSSGILINRNKKNNYRILEWRFRECIKDDEDSYFGWEACDWVDNVLMKELKKYKPVLCHGDPSYGNVLLFNNKPIWIDWELMQMSNPMFDLFYFFESLYSGEKISQEKTIGDFLSIYYENESLNKKEKENIVCMGLYFIYWRILNMAHVGIKDSRLAQRLIRLKEKWDAGEIDELFIYFLRG